MIKLVSDTIAPNIVSYREDKPSRYREHKKYRPLEGAVLSAEIAPLSAEITVLK